MLEVTEYKTYHVGAKQADKLQNPIKNSDVFSIEHAGMPKNYAIEQEKNWGALLKTGDLSLFFETMTLSPDKMLCGGQEFADYYNTAVYHCFRGGKPIYFLERWSKEGPAIQLASSDQSVLQLYGLNLIAQGQHEQGTIVSYEASRSLKELGKIRDRHQAFNLATAEDTIRETYQELQDLETIRLGIQNGRSHNIGKYASMSVYVEDIPVDQTPIDELWLRLDELLEEEALISEAEPILVKIAELYRPLLLNQ